MKLHSLDRKLLVTQAHDCVRAVFFGGPGADFEIGRKILFIHDERVVAGCRHRCRQAGKNCFAVVGNGAGFAVHEVGGANDIPSKSRADGLMPEANAENGNFAGEMANQIDADACILGRAGSGRDYDVLGRQLFDSSDGNLVVTANFDLGSEFPKILDQVVGKRVVIVENEDHGGSPAIAYTATNGQQNIRRRSSRLNGLFHRPWVALTEPSERAILKPNERHFISSE
jgi:hypothetical protein